MIPEQVTELQNNGTGKMAEIGTTGLDTWGGYIYEAYHKDLYWPTCYTLYNRLRRSDPEISIIRTLYNAMAHEIRFQWEMPEDPTPQDERVNEYLETVLDDIDGGQRQFIGTLVANVPFMGFGWWEAVPGLRRAEWRGGDGWQSEYDDNLVGFRKLAWRDHSSFESWALDAATGKLGGLVQHDAPNESIMIPIERSIHVKFGDLDNPEGLSPLEAVWRLERIKYGLEVVQGIGYEHSAGHVKFTAFEELDSTAKATIRQAARAILTAQEGNYITEIDGKFTADIIDVNFQAAPAILEAIRYYGLLKLQVYNMQWIAIASTAGGGAYSAMQDSSTMMISMWNAMLSGFAEQIGEQLWQQAARYNPALFVGTTKRQQLTATPIEKEIALTEMAQLLPVLFQTLPMDDDDLVAIRRKLGFLSETLPEVDEATGEGAEGTATATGTVGATLTQEKVLNGAQIASAIAIVQAYSEGLFPREIAVNMIVNFFNLSREVAEQLVPQERDTEPIGGESPPEPEELSMFQRFRRWSMGDDKDKDEKKAAELQDAKKEGKFIPKKGPPATESTAEDWEITSADIERVGRKFKTWANENEPALADILDAEVIKDDNETEADES